MRSVRGTPKDADEADTRNFLPLEVSQEVVEKWWAGGCYSACSEAYPSRERDVDAVKLRLAENHLYWIGVYWQDYIFHICNRHPVLSIFSCHPMHPFSKTERLCIELLRIIGTCSFVTCMKSKFRMELWINHSTEKSAIEQFIAIYLHITLPVTIVMYILMEIAVQTGRPDSPMERYLGHKWAKALQWWLMCICCRVVIILFVTALWLRYSLDQRNEQVYEVAWKSILQGWLLWFVKDNLLPVSILKHPLEFGFYNAWERQGREDHEMASIHSESAEEGFLSGWRGRFGF